VSPKIRTVFDIKNAEKEEICEGSIHSVKKICLVHILSQGQNISFSFFFFFFFFFSFISSDWIFRELFSLLCGPKELEMSAFVFDQEFKPPKNDDAKT